MAAKKKSTVEKVTTAVQEAAAAVAKAADEHVVRPVGKALGLTGEAKTSGEQQAGAKAGSVGAAPKLVAGKKSAAARTMTQPVAGKKSATARVMTKRVSDAPKPVKKSAAGGTGKGPRRGASKGR